MLYPMIRTENVFVVNNYKYKKQSCGGCQIICHSTFLKKSCPGYQIHFNLIHNITNCLLLLSIHL